MLNEWYKQMVLGDTIFINYDGYSIPSYLGESTTQLKQNEEKVYLCVGKPSFFPIFHNRASIPPQVTIRLSKPFENEIEELIEQYEEYLMGYNTFTNNKYLRRLRMEGISLLHEIGLKDKRDRVVMYEQRLMQNLWKVEISTPRQFVSELEEFATTNKFHNPFLISDEVYPFFLTFDEVLTILPTKQEQKVETQKETVEIVDVKKPVTNLMEYLPAFETIQSEIDDEKVKSVHKAFKRVGISDRKLNILDTVQNSTLYKFTIQIPPSTNYSKIKNNLDNLKAALGNENVSIDIGDQPDTINLYLPNEKRSAVYLRNVLESEEFQEFKRKSTLPFILGEDTSGKLLYACLSELKHLLVAGSTGSGKSVFLNSFIVGLMLSVPPEELILYLIDPKKVEMGMYDGFPQVRLVTDTKDSIRLLDNLVNEMEKRYDILQQSRYKNLVAYNKNHKQKIPYIVCVVDEYADLMIVNAEVENYIVRIAQKARAAGIHLVLTTQRPQKEIVTGLIKANLPSVVCFRLQTISDYKTVFGKGIPYSLMGKGDGVARLEGNIREFERFQSPCITLDENEEKKVFEKLKQDMNKLSGVEYEITEKEELNEKDKLKAIICKYKDLRVVELQKHMGIRINRVSELMNELVEDGWLRKDGRKYELVIDETEMKWWESLLE